MTREQTLEMDGAEIILKFENVPDGIRVHASFRDIGIVHFSIARDYIQKEALKVLMLENVSTERAN